MLNLTIDHAQLVAPLRRVAAVADPRSPVAAYAAIKLTTDQHGLLLTAANGTLLLTERIELPDCDAGYVYVSAARLRDLVGSLDAAQPITIRDDESGVRLQSGRTRARLDRISSTGFSTSLPTVRDPQIETTSDELARALGLILPAVGVDQDRPLFGSAHLAVDAGGVRLTAIDGTQGAVAWLAGATVGEFPAGGAMLPRATVTRLRALTKDDADTPLYIAAAQNLISIVAGDWALSSRLIAADPPAHTIWMAQPVAQPVVLDAAVLGRILARIDAGIDLDHVKLKQRGAELRVANGTMIVAGHRDELVDDMPVTCGIEPLRIGVNSRQLRHCLAAIGAERVELHIIHQTKPLRVCAAGETRESYTLSPYRV